MSATQISVQQLHKDGYIPDTTGPSHQRNAKRWIGAPSAVSVKMDAYVLQVDSGVLERLYNLYAVVSESL